MKSAFELTLALAPAMLVFGILFNLFVQALKFGSWMGWW